MKKEQTAAVDSPIKEDLRWVRREWLIQRAGVYLLILVVILGACGLFSKGVLSDSSARSPDGTLEVAYERFGRVDSNMAMRIRYTAPVTDHFTVTIGAGALDNLQIQTLQPQPLEAVTIGSDLRLTFSTRDTGPDHAIWLGLQPHDPGRIHVAINGDDHPPVRFTQWIYP
ncbi:hypothetical protein [Pantoea sp. GD03673]|uniref:hypothetical protein n=1 Tax=Pantoea sp. GD03673 TaxID=2975364 RepID=UPI0024494BF9|nr:hypothetical protein [Pantoea sp. GD03673]MDH2067426.1 hypothetical protein [Pantoea sp. GD03673]